MAFETDDRRTAVHEAAVTVFSARGFAGTSMAAIAEAAGVSRPALYQYFKNKEDVFASAFVALVGAAADGALAALDGEGSTHERLDGYLQRFDGDLWEHTSASRHSEELIALTVASKVLVDNAALARLHKGLISWLNAQGSATKQDGVDAAADRFDVLVMAPKGFKFDQPSVTDYRRRLSALAAGVAAGIDAAR